MLWVSFSRLSWSSKSRIRLSWFWFWSCAHNSACKNWLPLKVKKYENWWLPVGLTRCLKHWLSQCEISDKLHIQWRSLRKCENSVISNDVNNLILMLVLLMWLANSMYCWRLGDWLTAGDISLTCWSVVTLKTLNKGLRLASVTGHGSPAAVSGWQHYIMYTCIVFDNSENGFQGNSFLLIYRLIWVCCGSCSNVNHRSKMLKMNHLWPLVHAYTRHLHHTPHLNSCRWLHGQALEHKNVPRLDGTAMFWP